MPKATCSISDCSRDAVARTWCYRHWSHWKRKGSPIAPNPRAPIDLAGGIRVCKLCEVPKPLDQFTPDKASTGGRQSRCKACRAAHELAKYRADPETGRQAMRARREAKPDVYRAHDNARYLRDREKRIELAKNAAHKRRTRVAGATKERVSVPLLLDRDRSTECVYCGVEMSFAPCLNHTYEPTRATIDHRLPLSRGGEHALDNCVLCCWRCNVRKHARTDSEWIQVLEKRGEREPEGFRRVG